MTDRNQVPVSYLITCFTPVTDCDINIKLQGLHFCIEAHCKTPGNLEKRNHK